MPLVFFNRRATSRWLWIAHDYSTLVSACVVMVDEKEERRRSDEGGGGGKLDNGSWQLAQLALTEQT